MSVPRRVAITLLCVALAVANVADDMILEEETFFLSRPGAHKAEMTLVQEFAEDAVQSTASPSVVPFFIGCGKKAKKGSALGVGSHANNVNLVKYSSLQVPAGFCAKLFELQSFKGQFVEIVGSHKDNIWCLKDRALASKKTAAKNWAKQVRSAKISKCKALTSSEKNKNLKAIAKATVKAATKDAYKKGKSLSSIASDALSDALKTGGKVVVGEVKGKSGVKSSKESSAVHPKTAKRVSVCEDLTGFKDAKGQGCAEYTKLDLKKGLCKKFGNKKYAGKTANKFCCACGGGKKGVVPSLPPPVKAAVVKSKGKKGMPSAVNPNWYKYGKDHKNAWKKFVIPYPKDGRKMVIKKAKKDGMTENDEEDLKAKKNSKGKNTIDGGLKVKHDHHKGFVSDDARLGPGGHYYVGRRRRRIGAGFGRRRRTPKKHVVRRRSALPNKGLTSSKYTGKTPGAKPRCTHMKLKYKRKWPYCKKLNCFGGWTLKKAKHNCRKNNLCIGFTFDAPSTKNKKNGGGCMLAPPCRFFGSITYDYYVKDFECPKPSVRSPAVSPLRPPRVPSLGYASGKSYSSGHASISRSYSSGGVRISHHFTSFTKTSKSHVSKKTTELKAALKKAEAGKKGFGKNEKKQDCAQCVTEFKEFGGCTKYKVYKKDPSKLIPHGCSSCADKVIASCHLKGYSKVKSSKAAHKAAAKKLKKALKKSAKTVSESYTKLKSEAKQDANKLVKVKKELVENRIKSIENKDAEKAAEWAKKKLAQHGSKEAEDAFVEIDDAEDEDEAPIRFFGVDY